MAAVIWRPLAIGATRIPARPVAG